MSEASPDLPEAMRRMEADVPFQRRTWRAERIAWVVLLAVAAAALLGAFGGGGALVAAEAATPDGALLLRYERAQRRALRTTIAVEPRRAAPADRGRLEVRLGPEVLDDWEIQAATPPPAAARAGPDGGVVLAFDLAPGAAGGGAVVRLEAAPRRTGFRRLAVAAGDGPPARPLVLVWP